MKCTVNGMDVNYEIHGEGKPILVIHGWSPDLRLVKGRMEPLFEPDGGS
jgi:pimeloyl-ACP methyl ester carboxylesterase